LRASEPVIAAGFQGGGSELVVRRGIVAALYPYDEAPVIRTNAAFESGSSGGALLDESGNLVGVLAFKARTGDSLRFALPTEWLSATSAVAKAFSPVQPDSATSAFWEHPRDARPAFLGVAMREAASERN
jgi:S1-C subfamily serine protease